MLVEEKGAKESVSTVEPVIKEERCHKSRNVAKKVVLESKVIGNVLIKVSEQAEPKKKKMKEKNPKKKAAGKKNTTGARKVGRPQNKRKRGQKDYERYYGSVRKKFGWGVDIEKLTKEQLEARAKLKSMNFKRNTCPLCKSRFRMRSRFKEHVKKQTCSCTHCGMIYESAFQRSDHRWSCEVRLRDGMIKKEKQPGDLNSVFDSPLWNRPLFQTPPLIDVPIRSPNLALGDIPVSLRSESNFVLPSFALDFWPRIKQPLCPVENDKFTTRLQLDEPSEPSLGFTNVAGQLPNTLDREIKSLLVSDKLDIIVDF
jgi:hypothetical protein